MSDTKISSYFKYNEGYDQLPDGVFKISPSRLSNFFDKTSTWFRECVIKDGTVAFEGNTMSVLGTVVHGLAAMYLDHGDYDTELAEDFIDACTVPNIDRDFIRQQYQTMTEQLISDYLRYHIGKSEEFLFEQVIDGAFVAGSLDLQLVGEVVDFKTTSAKSAPTSIPRSYWFQQMAYVWMLNKKGKNVRKFTLVYITTADTGRVSEKTGKPLKDYPCTVTPLTHHVTDEDLALIDDVLRLVAESVKAYNEYPELRHIITQDMRLKVKPKLDLFKKRSK